MEWQWMAMDVDNTKVWMTSMAPRRRYNGQPAAATQLSHDAETTTPTIIISLDVLYGTRFCPYNGMCPKLALTSM